MVTHERAFVGRHFAISEAVLSELLPLIADRLSRTATDSAFQRFEERDLWYVKRAAALYVLALRPEEILERLPPKHPIDRFIDAKPSPRRP